MISFNEAFENFGKALGKLKEAYAEAYNQHEDYLFVSVNENNYVTITPTDETGEYIEVFRKWVNTDE